ncbi:MAG TPA: hypothetical protein VLA90_00815 [Actinomycetota bacterium]|nr:hypothetical protein [Actinomycetota bacterium]
MKASEPRTRRRRAPSTIAAGVLILGLTALFGVIGVDQMRGALDADRIDRETLLSAIGLGLDAGDLQTFLAITGGVLLALCAITASLGVGVLRRREGARHAAIGTFVVFAVITIPLAFSGLLSDDPPPGVLFGLGIGALDAAVVALLLRRDTSADFERAEELRARLRAERRRLRRARSPDAT